MQLSEEQLVNGVATHSSGNHAAAVAIMASQKKIKSYIVMPKNSPEIKKIAVRGYGGEVIESGNTQADRERTLDDVV